MNEILELIQGAAAFLGGAAIRSLIVIGAIAAFLLPFLAVYGLYNLFMALRRKFIGFDTVEGFRFAAKAHYSPLHTWLRKRMRGDVMVGLDDVAQRILTGATSVLLPVPGSRIRAGEAAIQVDMGGHVVTLPAPVTGVVTSINHAVAGEVKRMRRAPYDSGWLFAVKPEDTSYQKLPARQEARQWFQAESRRFFRFLDHDLGLAAADGGELLAPIASIVPREKWDHLVDGFLKTK